MEITRTFLALSGACLATPSSLEHRFRFRFRFRFSCSHLSTRSRVSSSLTPPLHLSANWPPPPRTAEQPADDERLHRTFLVEAFHQKRNLKALFDELSRNGSCPFRILSRDGDWLFEKLRAVIAFLADAGRTTEALQLFYVWKSREKSRANTANYSQIIQLFCEKNLIDKAVLIFQDMEKLKVAPSVETYNAIIHGYARIKEFHESQALFKKMVDDGLLPVPETFHGLIQAYGSHGLYDDMSKCVKIMESAGCFPNEATYNILIKEFARAGLVERMEKFYRIVLSKRMMLQSSALIAMLEAYADLGILEKMEKIYFKILNSNTYMTDHLIWKMASTYIENCRFARLEEFGNEIEGRTGRTELVWCILLLSSAGLMSRKGMNSISQDMELANIRWNTTFTNIYALFYLKIKDFRALNGVFFKGIKHRANPDMITVGTLFDACSIGFKCTHLLEKWKRHSYLEAAVEMRTDPLVMATFGKGPFMLKCEKLYTSLGSKGKEQKVWRYADLIRLVSSEWRDKD